MPRPKRPGQTSASPGRANINLGGVLGAAGAGSDNAGYAENAPANTPDVAPGDSADAWQNFMDTSRDNKYITPGGVLTNNPATDTRNLLQRWSGKPDVAGSINANLLAQRAGMPLQQQQATFESNLGTKAAKDKLDYGISQQPAIDTQALKTAQAMVFANKGFPQTPDAVAHTYSAYLAGQNAAQAASQAAEANSTFERDKTNLTKGPLLDTAGIQALSGVSKADLDKSTIEDPNYRKAYTQGQTASAALPVANLNKAMQLNVPGGDTVFTPPAVGYDLPTQHPGMMFQGGSHVQTQAPDRIMTDSKGVRTAIPSDKMITTPLPPQARGYHEEGGELYGIQRKPMLPAQINTNQQSQIQPQISQVGDALGNGQQQVMDPKVAALLMQWLQQTNGVRR